MASVNVAAASAAADVRAVRVHSSALGGDGGGLCARDILHRSAATDCVRTGFGGIARDFRLGDGISRTRSTGGVGTYTPCGSARALSRGRTRPGVRERDGQRAAGSEGTSVGGTPHRRGDTGSGGAYGPRRKTDGDDNGRPAARLSGRKSRRRAVYTLRATRRRTRVYYLSGGRDRWRTTDA